MNRIFVAACILLLGQPAFATSVAGINFQEIAGKLDSYQGSFKTNATGYPYGATVSEPGAIVDGNAASYVYSTDTTATLNLGFGTTLNAANRDLTILLVGNDMPHTVGVKLLNGASGSGSIEYTLDSTKDNTLGYTNFNMEMTPLNATTSAQPVVWGIYAMNIDLADFLTGGFTGDFSGVQLDISGNQAAPSLVGTTAAIVPVPAAVWLFGSGLLGLVGVIRKRA